ncbi:amino acid ABC transporter substrate-binding protein, PAAT family [Variovorax sp. HW608]|uniref:transporter substrate-binding domain-containing protein n=1 Tax=Variovorax sp. HW608 TaxID=1034889 RepID=UPI00081F9ADE|nr:transporter substrate-binding domain-containing protein [Variovorax sp. HW608]SCK12724.1 amino acid ABC transporter substrate-binding protein, PAAT family [Variovorax sp. HW608]
MKRRSLLALAASAACILSMGAAHADQDTLAAIREARTLRVALEFGRPPWGFKDDRLKMSGSDMEAAELLASDLGVKLEIVEVTGPNRIPFLQTKKADVVLSTFSITPERLKVIDFSAPYASAVQIVGAPKSLALKSEADLKGKRVGVTRATTGDVELTKKAKDLGAEVVRFDDESTNMTALASGQVDIVIQEPATLTAVAARNPQRQLEPKFIFTQFPVGIGLRKNDPALKSYLDQWVRTHMADGKLNAIYRKYHGTDLPAEIAKPAS